MITNFFVQPNGTCCISILVIWSGVVGVGGLSYHWQRDVCSGFLIFGMSESVALHGLLSGIGKGADGIIPGLKLARCFVIASGVDGR